MSFYAVLVRSLSILAIVGTAGAVALLALHASAAGRARLGRLFPEGALAAIRLAGGVALVATAASLYLSHGVGFPPCLLCWYQRIAMYPLVVIAGVAAVTRDARGWRYGLPLALTGLAIAVYHVALQLQPALEIVACDADAPCSARHLLVFGFISIPVLSAAAFTLITALFVTARTLERAAAGPE